MPIYEFECTKCRKKKEFLILNHKDSIPPKCNCGGTYKKLISQSSFILKGSGWYATDYANKDKKGKKSGKEKIEPKECKKSQEDKSKPSNIKKRACSI